MPRRLLVGVFLLAATLATGVWVTRASAQRRDPADLDHARALLDAMRGTAPIPCAFAMGVVEGNGWGRGGNSETDQVSDLRHWAAEGPSDPAVVPMLRSALAPGDACTRQVAARLLGRTHVAAATQALVDALHDGDPGTRELGAIGLGYAEDARGFDPLIAALSDTAVAVRTAAATALGQREDHRAIPALVGLLRNDRAAEVRRAAAVALGALD